MYTPVQNSAHQPVEALSPMCDVCRERDASAFGAFMSHLAQIDGAKHIVILVQVENEAGTLGTDRDYSPRAVAAFHGAVPTEVLSSLRRTAAAGASWSQVFAERASEAFMAYYTARYMDQLQRRERRHIRCRCTSMSGRANNRDCCAQGTPRRAVGRWHGCWIYGSKLHRTSTSSRGHLRREQRYICGTTKAL